MVIQKEDSRPRLNEPSGEPDSLVGKIKTRMGDKVQHEKPEALKKEIQEKKRYISCIIY